MIRLEDLLNIYESVPEVEMSPQFAYVYSNLVETTDGLFWQGVRKHALRNWYEKHKGLLNENIKIKYTPARIPKRSGGVRTLYIPDEKLKQRQRAWLEMLYIVFPRARFAYAFERGKSLRDSLEKHVGNYLFMKFDIQDAFPSVKKEVLHSVLERASFAWSVREHLIRDCYYKGLPQGAPTSGKLFNIVMSSTDSFIATVIRRVGGTYTRYADDILISFPRGTKASIRKTFATVERYLHDIGLGLNSKKVRVSKGKAKVLGCVVHSSGITISRKVRRLYRAMLHNNKTGKRFIGKDKINGIRGWLNTVYKGEEVPAVKGVEFK